MLDLVTPSKSSGRPNPTPNRPSGAQNHIFPFSGGRLFLVLVFLLHFGRPLAQCWTLLLPICYL